jgi:nitrite reductase/ring-hydroxylating ferredoxin subunit
MEGEMNHQETKLSGPDFTLGVALATVPDGAMLLGHAYGEPVLLTQRGDQLFAIGAVCTHYGAPLNEGLLVDDTVRCPWHHACFSLRTGAALRAPALASVSHWRVEVVDGSARRSVLSKRRHGTVYVREKLQNFDWKPLARGTLGSVVIIGGGAAGNAAAETLRHEGYCGSITMLNADESMPCDRPNLSKGYLAGTSSEESNFLRSEKF